MLDAAERDVLAHEELVLVEVLEDDADAAAQLVRVPVAQIAPVEQHAALGRVVEAREQLDERRLAGAVLADEREALAPRHEEIDAAQRPAFGVGVAEADVLEANALLVEHGAPGAAGDARAALAPAGATGIARYSNRFDM